MQQGCIANEGVRNLCFDNEYTYDDLVYWPSDFVGGEIGGFFGLG